MENCQNYILMNHCFPNANNFPHSFVLFKTFSLQLKNKYTETNIICFSPHIGTYVLCGNFLELHLDALLTSNCGETVLECVQSTCYHHLRMQLIHVSHHLLPSPNGLI